VVSTDHIVFYCNSGWIRQKKLNEGIMRLLKKLEENLSFFATWAGFLEKKTV